MAGRVKVIYDRGTWSEWYAWFDDGNHGWLAEAQGFYMMSFEAEWDSGIDRKMRFAPGSRIILANKKYSIDDVKQVVYAGMEGELPFTFRPGETAMSIDFSSEGRTFASISFTESENKLYLGKYVDFAGFGFKNLRELAGWKR